MQRGDILLVDFEPAQGAEADKLRPAVLVSNEGMNRSTERARWGVVTVVPLTANVSTIYDFQVLIPAAAAGIDRDSKAQAEQVRAVSFGRIRDHVGRLPSGLLDALDEALKRHLSL